MRLLLCGTFDSLHPGHRFVIERAIERGDLTIIVARDRTVERIKGRQPLHSEQERCEAIRALYPTVQVVLGDTDDFLQPIRTIAPDLLLLGYDQALPPGITKADLPCRTERLPAFFPEQFKSSKMRSDERA